MADSEGVFADIFPAEWAADPDFCVYLSELSGYPLTTLKKEPERLQDSAWNKFIFIVIHFMGPENKEFPSFFYPQLFFSQIEK